MQMRDYELRSLNIEILKNSQLHLCTYEILYVHLRPLLLFSLALFIQMTTSGVLLILSLALVTIALIDLFWLLHDIGHLAVFKNNKYSRTWVSFLSVTFFGFPLSGLLFETHRVHHAHPNTLFKDTAIETAPIYWSVEQLSKARSKSKLFFKHQNWLWFFVAIPLSTLFVAYDGMKLAIRTKNIALALFIVARWILVVSVFQIPLVFLLVPQILTGFWTGFVASLNHFHLDQLKEQDENGFATHAFKSSQNIRYYSGFATWITGGLNYHIEHHLFPRVPSMKLKYVRPYAQDLARQLRVPYREETPAQIVAQVWRKLKFLAVWRLHNAHK